MTRKCENLDRRIARYFRSLKLCPDPHESRADRYCNGYPICSTILPELCGAPASMRCAWRASESGRIEPTIAKLIQERFPVGRHPSCRSRSGLIFWMRMWRKQLRTLDHVLLLVIEEPVLTGLEAGYDRVPRLSSMLRCVLARRTVTASDMPTLRTPAEMKPPAFR